MRKIFLTLLILASFSAFGFGFKKKEEAIIVLTSKNPAEISSIDEKVTPQYVFRPNSKIYFMVSNPNGFKSDYIKYQIVKQNPNVNVGGYNRVRNITARVRNKNYFSSYFTLTDTGKYIIQVFDIENLQQWLANLAFQVVDE